MLLFMLCFMVPIQNGINCQDNIKQPLGKNARIHSNPFTLSFSDFQGAQLCFIPNPAVSQPYHTLGNITAGVNTMDRK